MKMCVCVKSTDRLFYLMCDDDPDEIEKMCRV